MKILFILLATIFFNNYALCQTAEQREAMRAQMSKEDSAKGSEVIKKYYANKKERIDKYLQKYPKTPLRYKKNGKLYILSDISSEGKPMYNTQKNSCSKN